MLLWTKQKGVTLIELLIVVLIIGALSAIAVPRISKSATAAKARLCHTNLDIINTAIEEYRHNMGGYPKDLEEVTRNLDYFPDGEPICPITGKKYPRGLKNDRVDASAHAH